jgi:hypothetical protein
MTNTSGETASNALALVANSIIMICCTAVSLRSRFKIQPTADCLERFLKQLLIKRENADRKHLDASLSVIYLLLK